MDNSFVLKYCIVFCLYSFFFLYTSTNTLKPLLYLPSMQVCYSLLSFVRRLACIHTCPSWHLRTFYYKIFNNAPTTHVLPAVDFKQSSKKYNMSDSYLCAYPQ